MTATRRRSEDAVSHQRENTGGDCTHAQPTNTPKNLRTRLSDKIDVERLLHRRLVVLADQAVALGIVSEHIGRSRIADVIEFDDDLKSRCPLHPDRARDVNRLWIEVRGLHYP